MMFQFHCKGKRIQTSPIWLTIVTSSLADGEESVASVEPLGRIPTAHFKQYLARPTRSRIGNQAVDQA